jgi:hypothetical protein
MYGVSLGIFVYIKAAVCSSRINRFTHILCVSTPRLTETAYKRTNLPNPGPPCRNRVSQQNFNVHQNITEAFLLLPSTVFNTYQPTGWSLANQIQRSIIYRSDRTIIGTHALCLDTRLSQRFENCAMIGSAVFQGTTRIIRYRSYLSFLIFFPVL